MICVYVSPNLFSSRGAYCKWRVNLKFAGNYINNIQLDLLVGHS